MAAIIRIVNRKLLVIFTLVIAFGIRIGIWLVYLNKPELFLQPDTMSYW